MDGNQYNNQYKGQYNTYGQDSYNPYYEQPYQSNQFDTVGGMAQDALGQVSDTLCQEVVAKSFLYMVAALAVTAIAAFTSPYVLASWLMRNSYNIYILCAIELAVVIISNVAIAKNNAALTAILFTVYAYITGALLGIIFWAYDLTSVGAVFLMTAGMFGVMAIYGMVTKRDLSSVGNICLMGLIGIIIASLVNVLFIRSGIFDLVVSVVGVLIFVALTAYDMQKIKGRVMYANDTNMGVMALSGAFELYLDFINIFLRLLRLFGKRK